MPAITKALELSRQIIELIKASGLSNQEIAATLAGLLVPYMRHDGYDADRAATLIKELFHDAERLDITIETLDALTKLDDLREALGAWSS